MQQYPEQPQPQYQQPLGEQWQYQPNQNYGPPPYPQQQQMYPQQPVNVNINMQPQQPQYQPYPQQYQQPMMQQPVMMNNISVNMNQGKQHGLFARALYFIFIGSWLGFLWLNIGFGLCVLIVTLPLGLAMLNRLPGVLTLKSRNTSTNVQMTSVMANGMMVNSVNVNVNGTQQVSFLVRALYFVFVGWWAGYMWALLGYGICMTVLGLPLGLMMLNRLPMVLTLRKN